MEVLNLKAETPEQKKVKECLEQIISDVLAEKINNGVRIEKNGKTLINKKDLDGFMKYACEEARKLAESGATSACIEGNVIIGWAVHYFEEDSIEGTLYNEDGTVYSKPALAPKPKKESKPSAPKEEKPKKDKKALSDNQFSLFDLCG